MTRSNVVSVDFAGPLSAPSPEVAAAVRRAAALVAAHAGRPVRVRFSGASGAAAASGIYRLEVSAGAYPAVRRLPGEGDGAWRARREAAPRETGVDVCVDAEWLADGALATEGGFGGEYATAEHTSVEAAAAWVRERCLRSPVDRVTSADVASWKRMCVTAPFDGRPSRVPILQAARVYGSLYRYEISAAALVDCHGISTKDAAAIEEVVRKVLPRRRT